ncbi:hypothetical protein OZX74_03325 [Bifidobacterium sp. ESL0798]|uniref:sensor histidine kinase n=1 Tax=Bifidobacterium sp. ESL0798 TaxID=2983235 RepID=UPI0023F8393B|nr:ATP-binding protein [Bifidobacterium sp. ESL0798]WEV74944.1 hypothetical protein OZX74_03325 [Bifidobacterium sp. ESL0798]
METIRHESQRAQHDMDGLLSAFGGISHAGYGDIAGLVKQANVTAQTTNGNVIHTVGGNTSPQPERLGDKAQSAIYHAVLEALTNARKYAGKGVTVEVKETWSDNGLHLTVRDNGNGAAATLDGHRPGYGITGMRERIEAVGGIVAAGPRVGGGFEVDIDLPFDRTSKASSETASPSKATSPTDTAQSSQTRSLPQTTPTSQADPSFQTASPSPAKPLSQAVSQSQAEKKIRRPHFRRGSYEFGLQETTGFRTRRRRTMQCDTHQT